MIEKALLVDRKNPRPLKSPFVNIAFGNLSFLAPLQIESNDTYPSTSTEPHMNEEREQNMLKYIDALEGVKTTRIDDCLLKTED
jgi:hypothetical protein